MSDHDAWHSWRQGVMLELIFHMKDTIMKTESRRFCDFSAAVHLMKEGGNGPD